MTEEFICMEFTPDLTEYNISKYRKEGYAVEIVAQSAVVHAGGIKVITSLWIRKGFVDL